MRILIPAVVVVLVASLVVPTAAATERNPPKTPARLHLNSVDFATGTPQHQISAVTLVKFRARATTASPKPLQAQAAGLVSGRVELLGGQWVAVHVDTGAERRALRHNPAIAAVDVDHVRTAQTNDPAFRRHQPYLRNTMDYPQAWKRQNGTGVTVAVVDTGVDASHPDLGKVLRGHDFVDNDRQASDPNGHGTFTAGIIGARRGNNRGIAGASRATILPVRVLNARGFGRDSDIAHGIRWAVNHHADVINLSLGAVRYSRITRDAARYAERHGVVVVASSGNSGGTRKSYPAAYPTVVAVGATDDNDQLTWFSQRGEWVDVVAPGWEIASTVPGNRYGLGSGTSFSAPLVSGAAALLVGAHPHWRPAKIRATLLRSTADAGAVGPDLFTGFGVIDVDGALGGRISTWAASALGGKAEIPTTARPLDRRVEGSLDPEGASPWFVYQSGATKEVSVEARLSKSRQGVLRGDLAFDVYDADMHLIRRVDRWNGSGTERTTIKTGASFYVRLRNTEQTRAPGHFVLVTSSGEQRNSATVGGGPRPVLVDASPAPNATGAPRSGDLVLTLGRAILPTSISARTVRLIDGNTGESVARAVDYDPVTGTLTIDPVDRLPGKRDYALVLKELRMPNGSHLTETWMGFRTG